jgi:hypothetical protein
MILLSGRSIRSPENFSSQGTHVVLFGTIDVCDHIVGVARERAVQEWFLAHAAVAEEEIIFNW